MPNSTDQQDVIFASVYAGPLYDLAQERGVAEQVGEELRELAKLCEQDAEFARFVASPIVSVEQRRATFDRLFKDRVHELTANTLQVMNDHERSALIPALAQAYVARQQAASNEVPVTVWSAVALDDGQQAAVAATAERLAGRKPVLRFEVDEALIGGLVVEIDGVRYDYSARRQLRQAERRLVERGQRGLQVSYTNDGV